MADTDQPLEKRVHRILNHQNNEQLDKRVTNLEILIEFELTRLDTFNEKSFHLISEVQTLRKEIQGLRREIKELKEVQG